MILLSKILILLAAAAMVYLIVKGPAKKKWFEVVDCGDRGYALRYVVKSGNKIKYRYASYISAESLTDFVSVKKNFGETLPANFYRTEMDAAKIMALCHERYIGDLPKSDLKENFEVVQSTNIEINREEDFEKQRKLLNDLFTADKKGEDVLPILRELEKINQIKP